MFKFEDSGGGSAVLDDAWGNYNLGNGWNLKFGQFKLPLFREELVGDEYTLFANRSVVNSFFTQKRSQGVQISYEGDAFRFAGAFSDGINTANTDYTSPAEADFALTARGEFKFAGDWKHYKDFTSFRDSAFFAVVGGAVHYQSGGDTVNTTNVDNWDFTLDAQVEGNGWNAFAAFYYSNIDPNTGNSVADMAFQLQGGVFVAADWEIVGGFSILMPDSDRSPSDSDFSTIQLGVNHYVIPESHAIKISVDLSYFLDTQSETGIAVPSTATGLLASGQDSQWNLRGQIQLVF
jgi:hypothetical protein